MAEETIITNVGEDDRSSVASEATLLSLVSAIEKLAKAAGINPASARAKVEKAAVESTEVSIEKAKKHQEAIKDNTKEFKEATKAVSAFSKGFGIFTAMIGGVAQSGFALADQLIFGSEKLGDFAQHIPLIGSTLQRFASHLDNTFETFRELATSGAAFNNSIVDMRLAAAQARMGLDDFGSMILRNTEQLAAFGGTVTRGAQTIGRMQDGLGNMREDLLNMGFTFEEINEGMINYLHLNRSGARAQTQDTQMLSQQAGEYLKQLSMLSKLTGKSVSQQQDELSQMQTNAAFQLKLSKMAPEERAQLQQGLATALATGGDVAAQYFMQQALGMPPLTEATQIFAATMGRTAREIENLAKAALDTGNDFDQIQTDAMVGMIIGALEAGENFEGAISAAAAGLDGPGQTILEILNGMGIDFAKYRDDQGNINEEAIRQDLATAAAEGQSRDRVVSAMAAFNEAIRTARTTIEEAFVTSGVYEAAATAVQMFADGIAMIDGDTIDRFFNAITGFTNWLLGEEYEVVEPGTGDVHTGRQGGFIDRMIADIEEKGIGQVMLDLFAGLGTTLMEGAWAVISDGITALWEDTRLIDYMIAGIAALWAGKALATAITAGISGLFARAALPAVAGGAAGGAAGGRGGAAGDAARGRGGALRGMLGRGFLPLALGMTALELYNIANDEDLSRDERTVAQTEAGGGLAGGLAGAAAGAAIGSVVPIIGTTIGGIIGGMLGYSGGRFAGGMIGESITGTEESEIDRLIRNLEAERQQISESASISGIMLDSHKNRLSEIDNEISAAVRELREQQVDETEAVEENTDELETLNESTNTVIIELQRLITIMSEVRDTERSMLEIQQYLAQLSEEQLQELRDIDDNTDNLSADVSRGGITQFAS